MHEGDEHRVIRGIAWRWRGVLRHCDHVWVVRGDLLNDAGDASAAPVLDVPGEEPHLPEQFTASLHVVRHALFWVSR